jgi:hypothetical protein
MPVLVEPVAAVEAFVVEPVHGNVIVLGIGTPISGLMPPLSISVAPSGIVPPFSVVLEVVPDVDSGEATPVEVMLLDPQTEVELIDPVELNPLPSKVEFVPDIEVIPDPLDPESPELAPLALQFELAVGLRPPGLISVAPNGMPVPPFDPVDVLEPSMPSGDVAPMAEPMAGMLVGLCAPATPQPSMTTAASAINTLMEAVLIVALIALLKKEF